MKIAVHFSKILILFFLLFSFYGNPLFGQVLGDYKSVGTGNWSTLSSWQYYNGISWVTPSGTSPQGYPGQFVGNGSVLIQTGHVITTNVSTAFPIGSITINGQLTINDLIKLVLTNDFAVNSGGSFIMPGGSGVATLIVYWNYINSGTTNFWKSIVIILGDLLSPSTSSIQANGNVFVAGNIIGDFSTTGGTGANQIYALNPNATVTITPQSIDNTVPPGVVPTLLTETKAIVDLVNATVYGSTCVLASSGTTNISACSGISATFSVSTTASSPSFQWQVNSGASWVDVSAISFPYPYLGATSNSFTISNVLIGMNNYKFRAKITSGSCTKNGDFGTLTVNVSPTAPINGLISLPTNGSTNGSVSLSGLPSSWGLTQTGTINVPSFSGSTTATTVYNLGVGTYYFTVSNGTCSSVATTVIVDTNKTWNGFTNTDWNTATNWTPNGVPTKDNSIIILDVANDPIISGTNFKAYCFSITIQSPGSLTVNSTNSITVTDLIKIESGGSLTFENNASLIQVNNASNTGKITYKRTTSVLANNYDFVYWGSPVNDQKLGAIWMASNWNDTFYNFNPSINNWDRNYAADSMIPGKGYISRARNGQSGVDYNNVSSTFNLGGAWTAKFYGVPNNGDIRVSNIANGKYCLLSNPYPSAIDASAFLLKNNAVLGGTIYFWTHNSAITNNTYTSNDYAAFNGVGSTATVKSISNGLNTNVPSGKIAAGQAFFATAIASNNVVFDNSMRVDNSGNSLNNTQFFKTSSNTKIANEIEKNRVWLNLTNDQGLFKQMLIGYITGATNDFDSAFDGESMNGNSFIDFYSINQNRNFTIQGRALPFDENDIVPLGFKTTISGVFKINRYQVDGLLTNQAIYIEDKVTNTIVDLNNGDYTFTTVAGKFNDRFVLRYVNKTLGTDSISSKENQVFVSNINKQIKINSAIETIDKVLVCDLLGKVIYKKNSINSKEFLISNIEITKQTLLIKIILENGTTVARKIIF